MEKGIVMQAHRPGRAKNFVCKSSSDIQTGQSTELQDTINNSDSTEIASFAASIRVTAQKCINRPENRQIASLKGIAIAGLHPIAIKGR